MFNFTQKEIEIAFYRLEVALKGKKLKRFEGEPTEASASEFMLMQKDKFDCLGFKHCESLNYIYLYPYPTNELYIPETDKPFNQGIF